MPTGLLQIRNISGHSSSVPGRGVHREEEVCKYIDVTTCIGCKACVVACQDANGLPRDPTGIDARYDAPVDLNYRAKNVIKLYHRRDRA